MIRPATILAALVLGIAGPAAAQQAAVDATAGVQDETRTTRYLADFAHLCLDTGGDRAAVRAAAAAAGWQPGVPEEKLAAAVDLAVFESPDGQGGRLLTSASSPGELDGGLIVRTCILQSPGGTAGSVDRLVAGAEDFLGLPGRRTPQGVVWMVSGSRAAGFVDEARNFAAAGSTEAGFALALTRPLLVVNLVREGQGFGLSLMRVGPE